MTVPRPIAVLLLAAAAVGCTETRSYNLAVRNDLDRPVTACLTKSAGPAEPDWESPEQAAGPDHPASNERPPGVVLPPGRTASRRDVEGTFYTDRGRAVLRVYDGTPTLTRMNAIARGDGGRLDLTLQPGDNAIAIVDNPAGQMMAVPLATAPAPTTRP